MKLLELEARQIYQELKQSSQSRKRFENLKPGDIVKFGEEKFIYVGTNPNGTPFIHGIPAPFFRSVDPMQAQEMYYLMEAGPDFPLVFLDPKAPQGAYAQKAYLNGTIEDLTVVGHITPSEWRRRCSIAFLDRTFYGDP